MRTTLLVTLAFLTAFTTLAACKETPALNPAVEKAVAPQNAPTAPAAPTAPDERITAADQQCAQDSDCALTTADCCGCNASGKQIGVRADVVASLAKRRAPVCSGISCAQSISDDPTCTATKAVCKGGKCQPDVAASTGTPRMKPTPVEPIPPG